jgi:transposase-like protein
MAVLQELKAGACSARKITIKHGISKNTLLSWAIKYDDSKERALVHKPRKIIPDFEKEQIIDSYYNASLTNAECVRQFGFTSSQIHLWEKELHGFKREKHQPTPSQRTPKKVSYNACWTIREKSMEISSSVQSVLLIKINCTMQYKL